MKTAIHPTYFPNAKVICACGNTFTVGATAEELRIELCSNCHPFFTGRQKLMDTEGRVQRFTKKFGAQTVASRKKAPAKATGKGSKQSATA